jgi:lysophospholipase L1-like esterase
MMLTLQLTFSDRFVCCLRVTIAMLFVACGSSTAHAQLRQFHFGVEESTSRYTAVKATDLYSSQRGFGFEPDASIKCTSGRNASCTSTKPFYFSIAVPEGNYRVSVRFGDRRIATSNVVKAELRRLMLERIDTNPGEFVSRSFIVNVRTPQISTGGEVKLKDRERASEQWAWDEKLTLEFNGTKPAINSITIEPADVPTIFLLGDSTVCDQPGEPYASWGQMITRFFGDKVAVANHAQSGESLRSSFRAKRLEKVLSVMKAGDFLLIQFGHNDMKERGEGVGAFTTYKASLRQFTQAAKAKGAKVIILNPMHRRTFDASGKITNSHGDYPVAAWRAAKEESVAFIDLHSKSQELYEALGPDGSGVLFKQGDGTHHNAFGAYQIAKIIVQSIRDQDLPLAKFLTTDWKKFDPTKPDDAKAFVVPASPALMEMKPLGS